MIAAPSLRRAIRWRRRRHRPRRGAGALSAQRPAPRARRASLLFNGRDGEWRAALESLGKNGGAARAVEQTPASQRAEPDLWLVFAPMKRARIDFLVEKATELGVRAAAAGDHPAHHRRAGQSRAAARQCHRGGRADRAARPCPRSRDARAARRAAGRLAARSGACCCATKAGAAPPIADALGARMRRRRPWAVLDRARGRLRAAELDALGETPICYAPSASGRASCAPIRRRSRRCACWQALLGDWRAGRGA